MNTKSEKYEQIEGIDASTYAGKAIKALKTKARGIMGDDLLIFHLIDFVTFMVLNNKFASKGIFITDENKEEQYIKIIESGDENLIQDLEKYIDIRDKLFVIERQKSEYTELVEKIKSLNDYENRDEINSIIENYLRR